MVQVKAWYQTGAKPVQRQAITWTDADLLPIRTLRTNFSEIRIEKNKANLRDLKAATGL